jgi:hypothetical protein
VAKVTLAVDLFNLVVPLAPQPTANATAMRITDTAGQLDLFGQARSGAVSPLIDAGRGLRRGDVDSTNGHSIAPTATTLGCRTSATATRTTTTRTTSFRSEPSADETAARHADFSLQDLVQAYLDCRRAKRTKPSARAFEMRQEALLAGLNEALANGAYRPGKSVCFVITRPKPREVWAAPFADRVVHHLLYNKIAPRFERAFIADSCACIPGRGTLHAARRLEHHIRSATRNWSRRVYYLKLDIQNFFVSIDKPILRDLLAKRVHEPWWMALAELILMHDPRPGALMQSGRATMARVPAHKSLLNQSADKGLPIGNLSSQFFANVYLDVLDQFVKHRLRCRHYVRYVDDFILLHESPQWLNRAKVEIEQLLADRLRICLNPAKTILQPVDRGVDFVGQMIKPWRRTLRRRTYHESIARAASIEAADLFTTANSYFGLLRQATHSHVDRARLANVLRGRGHSVNRQLTKTYRRAT